MIAFIRAWSFFVALLASSVLVKIKSEQLSKMPPLNSGSVTTVYYEKGLSPNSSICKNVTVSEKDIYDIYFGSTYSWQRPVKNSRQTLNIGVRVVLSGINEVNERQGIVRLTGFLNLRFQDEIHVWNKTYPYACLDSIHLPQSLAWVPEVALLNSERKYDLIISGSGGFEKFRIFSNGTTSYRPGGTFDIYCQFDLTYMPFDQQICRLEFESWRYVTEFQTLSFGEPAFSFVYWIENGQWHLNPRPRLHKTWTQYLSESTYDHLTFEFILTRKQGFYWMNVIIPSMIISIAKLSVFALPIYDVIKMHVQFTCLLAYGVFQLMIIEDMPRSSDHIPLLSYYIDLSMGYICLAILGEGITFACLRFSRDRKHRRRVPKWLFTAARMVAYPLMVSLPVILRQEEQNKQGTKRKVTKERNLTLSDEPSTSWHSLTNDNSSEDAKSTKSTAFTYTNNIVRSSKNDESPKMSSLNDVEDCGNGDDDEDTADTNKDKSKSRRLQRWRFLAHVIDRLTFFGYFFCTISTPTIMFGIIPAVIKQYE